MKRQQLSGVLLLAAASCTAQAEGWYLGASAGVMDANISGFDEATNVGVLVGYDIFTMDIFSVSLEGELTTTVSDGSVKFGNTKGDWDIDTQAAHVAARIGNTFYIKVRYGVTRADVSVSVADSTISGNDTGGTWGGALGWMFSKHWGMQVDGTLVDPDVTYWNAGVRYQF
ncbi:hypothetical protein MNBD_GAMMA13-587 [hydrothermal vent metagenome]|uniref:Outer membrane protein beta-barrel domain-containing protein n=1 Tax=hydrothermal vent metagenome TaxID=652676 RepID=A0A3B0YZ45_9ZZZZ